MRNLVNLTLPELTAWMQAELGEPVFRAAQVWQWIWQKMARDFEVMSNVSKTCRVRLAESACIVWPQIVSTEQSRDGTTKFLLLLDDGALIESVLIPSDDRKGKRRWTQCLSSQVGCAMGCTFCATGQMGFERNMTMGEMLGQVLVARDWLDDTRPDRPLLRNLVFMGMGEPLLNMRELLRALTSLNDGKGLNFSPRRLTVSTCGIEKGLSVLGQNGLAYLAVSLHAPNQRLRERIMPKAARWPLDKLITTLKSYPLKTRERITFEYLLLGDVNDSLEHARELAHLVGDVKGKLNLIVYNQTTGSPYAASDTERILAFEQYLWSRHITVVLRKSKGQDINAACGQLKADRRSQAAKFSRRSCSHFIK
ncbi:MAG: ribosomal RNA large subunit methyltransferase N [Candidatus Desulfovibrio kirbyi]|uniref:Probable dual-specificity RNA methyltransferase RlmN n=1 Tax=Candidatus Desulfovibrio kirbyi TaxID=2696086 RepID=A0A6L2R463_9BACT|nr:MAG: ribosomal RNA large subunit methyltransferase N [Candidatus Desulfovibrio kirbyi]